MRHDVLIAAAAAVQRGREQHGASEDSFGLIARLWGAYLGCALGAEDVARMMILFKVARDSVRPGNPDNPVDIAGYAACLGELAQGHGTKEKSQ